MLEIQRSLGVLCEAGVLEIRVDCQEWLVG